VANQPTVTDPIRQQWMAWAATQPKIHKRQRARAADAALAALSAGATQDQAIAAAYDASQQGYATYYATASLIVGFITLAVTVFTGGIALLFAAATIFAGYQGLRSRSRQWQAIVGLVFGALSIVLFVVGLFLRR